MTILEGYSGDADLNDPEKDLTKLDIIDQIFFWIV